MRLGKECSALNGEGGGCRLPTFTACLLVEIVLQHALEIVWVGLVSEEIKEAPEPPK